MDSHQIEDVLANEWKKKTIDKIIEIFPSAKESCMLLVEFEFYCGKHVKYELFWDCFVMDLTTQLHAFCSTENIFAKLTYAMIVERNTLKSRLCMSNLHKSYEYCPIRNMNKTRIGGQCFDYFSCNYPYESPYFVSVEHVFVLWHMKWLQLMMIYEYYKNPDDFAWNNVERVFADEYMLKTILRY